MRLNRLASDTRGAAAIELAFALPILVTLMIGTLQFALVLDASGTMRHAAGEGIRYAKVHPSATQTDVLAQVRSKMAGVNPNGITSMSYVTGTLNGAQQATISIGYQLQPLIPFAPIPPIRINESRTGYLPGGASSSSSSSSTSTSSTSSSSTSGGPSVGG